MSTQLREEQLKKQNEILVRLAKLTTVAGGDLKTRLPLITRMIGEIFTLDRAGIWLHNRGKTKLLCADLLQMANGIHTSGVEFFRRDYYAYFEELDRGKVIVADDIRSNPLTASFAKEYFDPFGIRSVIDVPLRIGVQIMGVIRCERARPGQAWTQEEEVFAGGIADLVSLAIESTERRRIEILNHAVYRIAQATETVKDLGELYEAIHRIIQSVMPANNFYIAHYDAKADMISFPYFVD